MPIPDERIDLTGRLVTLTLDDGRVLRLIVGKGDVLIQRSTIDVTNFSARPTGTRFDIHGFIHGSVRLEAATTGNVYERTDRPFTAAEMMAAAVLRRDRVAAIALADMVKNEWLEECEVG